MVYEQSGSNQYVTIMDRGRGVSGQSCESAPADVENATGRNSFGFARFARALLCVPGTCG